MTDQATRLPFFVYGTLRRGCGNYEWALAGKTTAEAEATLSGGLMYDYMGGFPYVALTSDPEAIIVGEVMTIAENRYTEVLRVLDRLEGYVPGRPQNHYERIVTTVRLATGEPVEVYTYVASNQMAASGRLNTLPAIPTGDWKTYHSALPVSARR
jgi:gamma-glutamylcyclotransferase (GGCT)/AIG2-like uncharacterized protein YtfP